MTAVNYKKRLDRITDELVRLRLDSFLVTNRTNVSYLSGFRGHDSMLLITGKKRYFITDSRYIEEVTEDVKGFQVLLVKESAYALIADLIKSDGLRKTGFESMNLPYAVAERLRRMASPRRLEPVKGLVEDLRAVKDACEIEMMKASARLAKGVLSKITKMIRPGISEDQLAKRIEEEFIKRGAHCAFASIVASGCRSSRPHAAASGAIIKKDCVVMIDMGCNLNGYNSDITRTLCAGRMKARFEKIFDIVKRAQALAIEKIKPGKRASEIDFAARGFIHKNGFGKYFVHSLGHGVGMDVHERPAISKSSEDVLRPGMIFTVEPAIYIPGFGGVRVEDMVLVTDDGCEVLTYNDK